VTRSLTAVPVAFAAFALILVIAAFALRSGFLPDDAVTLWAGAIAAGDGEMAIGRIVSVYPSIPFLATSFMELVAPAGTPTPALLAALLFALMAAVWFTALRASGLGLAVALIATVLIAFHPAVIRAAIVGPAEMFLVVFLFMLAKGLYDLRAVGAAPEVMTVAFALLGLAFSHPMGAAIAVASVPFLVLAVRPALLEKSALNVVLVLVFPTVFCVGAFIYVSWLFPGSGWSFFTAPAASLAAWTAGMARAWGQGLTGWLAFDTAVIVIVALALAAPAALIAIVWVHQRRPLVAPAVVLIAAAVTAAVITVITGAFGEPVSVLIAAPVLAATVMIRIPDVRARIPAVLGLLVLGWLGGAAAVAVVDRQTATHIRDAFDGTVGDHERLDALNLGHASSGSDGIMIDTLNAPAVVLGRGSARGLEMPQGETFALAILFARIDAPFIAVPDPQSAAGAQDQLNKVFPRLYRFGAPGYRLVYQNSTWRLFARVDTRAVSND
jgi:membrane protein XagC